jgi:hypothetical protein
LALLFEESEDLRLILLVFDELEQARLQDYTLR